MLSAFNLIDSVSGIVVYQVQMYVSIVSQSQLFAVSLQVLQDVTGDEFQLLMRVLSGLSTMSTLQGRKQLVEIVCEQADLDTSFDVSRTECIVSGSFGDTSYVFLV